MRLQIVSLEERVLLDAAAATNVASAYVDLSASGESNHITVSLSEPQDSYSLSQNSAVVDSSGTRVLVISSDVQDAETLAAAAQSNVKVILYDAKTTTLNDLSAKIASALNGQKADSIAFANHGTQGQFSLTGDQTVSLDTLQNNSDLQSFWKNIGDNLKDGGRVDLLACNLASSQEGLTLISDLNEIINDTAHYASVAASTDITGNIASGNWLLEVGQIDTSMTYFNASLSTWTGDLAAAYQVKDINTGSGSSSPISVESIGQTVYFAASDGTAHGTELWKSDGTSTGTALVKDINLGSGSSNPTNITVSGATIYFTASDGTTGTELWKSDGTVAGTVMVKDISSGATSSNPTNLTMVGSTLYFSATDSSQGTELWKSNGTAAGTVLVKDITIGSGSSSPANFAVLNGTLYFSATDGTNDIQLWKSDGTSLGTSLVKVINTTNDSNPANLTVIGSTLYFSAIDGTTGNKHGIELWKSDGTAAGTLMVSDILSGKNSSSPSNLTAIGTTLYFTATDGTAGVELWKSDGTAAGTVIVKNINPGVGSSSPASLINISGTLYFSATDGSTGVELWKSDGTTAGTVVVKDISSGSTSSNPTNFTNLNGTLYFIATNAASGTELWVSDGTSTGTALVQDVRTGTGSSSPTELTAAGTTLFFSATDGSTGVELWVYDTNQAPTALNDDFSVNEDNTLTVSAANGVLANDTDPNTGDTITAVTVTGPAHADTFVFNPDGSFTYKAIANYSGTDTFTYQTKDSHNLLSNIATVTLTINASNDAPVNSTPPIQSMSEDNSLIFSTVNGNAITITDIDAGMAPEQVTLTVTNGTLNLSQTTGLTFTTGTGTNDTTAVFTGTLANINAALNGLTFNPNSNFNGSAQLTITTNDQGNSGLGGSLSDTKAVIINVAAVNDLPVNSIPTLQSISEDSALIFSAANGNAITISDVDAGAAPEQVTLTVTNGTLSLGQTAGITFITGTGTNDTTIVFTGTIDNINAALNGLIFNPNANFNGPANLTITTNDLGNSGLGGSLSDTKAITIDVTATNDPPVNSVPNIQSVSEDSILIFSSANGNAITVSDIDAGIAPEQVTLTVTNGTLSLGQITGITFSTGTGTNDTTIVFTGTIDNINAALNGLAFNPNANFNGLANLTITTNDLGNSGLGRTLSDTKTVTIDVAAANDSPINNVPSTPKTPIIVPPTTQTDLNNSLIFSKDNDNSIYLNKDDSSNIVQMTIEASRGDLTLNTTSGLTFIKGRGIADQLMVFRGSIEDINIALDGLLYQATSEGQMQEKVEITLEKFDKTNENAISQFKTAIAINLPNELLNFLHARLGDTEQSDSSSLVTDSMAVFGPISLFRTMPLLDQSRMDTQASSSLVKGQTVSTSESAIKPDLGSLIQSDNAAITAVAFAVTADPGELSDVIQNFDEYTRDNTAHSILAELLRDTQKK
jgi:ELWxxDGT repeat protein/VCBS repeat-containing protein